MDDDVFIRHNVVVQMRVYGRSHFGGTAFDFAHETEQGTPIVGLGEAFSLEESSALELFIGVEKAVGCDEFDARGLFPPRKEELKETRDRGFSNSDGAGDANDEGGAGSALA